MPARVNNNFKIFYALTLAWQLGFIIVFPLLGFILLGIYLDDISGRSPFFLIVGVLTGLGINAYEMFHLFDQILERRHD